MPGRMRYQGQINALSVQEDLPFQEGQVPGNWLEMRHGIPGTPFGQTFRKQRAPGTTGSLFPSGPIPTLDGDLR
ncbi:MAG TPA: hypothetical protein PKW51_05950 [Methanoregulaceae archaeon]|nr:hypothetical protein [Methanoregulaceae archaeon]